MATVMQSLRRFLTAEEVPRWFGLSIVLIYLVGLGTVAQYGMDHAREGGVRQVQRATLYAIHLLADRLTRTVSTETIDRSVRHQAALREFAAVMPLRWVRVIDGEGRVVASSSERGRTDRPAAPARISTEAVHETWGISGSEVFTVSGENEASGDLFVRVRISDRQEEASNELISENVESTTAGAESLWLEARLDSEPIRATGWAGRANTLTTVLILLGALFVVYRCLREQLRGVSHIAQRLQLPRERLEDDLHSLRLADTMGGVTTVWNELIDLTQRQAEAVLRADANQELSRALEKSGGVALAQAFSALPDGIIYVTEESCFEYVNTSACRLLGWKVEDIADQSLSTAEGEGVAGTILDLMRDALTADGSFEERSVTLDECDDDASGHTVYRVRILPLQRAQHPGECVVLIRDVSQQVRAERAREEFITQVTHELRTPLTNIRAYTETLSSGMFDDPKVITECYNVITKETRRLSRLVEDVLSISQMEVGTIDLQVSDVDLKALLSEGIRDVRGLSDEKNIDIQLELPAKMEPLQGDRDKLAVVMNNLLGNAIKYTPEHGQILVTCNFAADTAVVSVKDNGIGIAPEDHDRIFEKFQRADDREVLNQTGTGIGLFTAREIVRRHRGEIELVSEKGVGSTFIVHLPRQVTRAHSATQNREET